MQFLKKQGTYFVGIQADVKTRFDRIQLRQDSTDNIDFQTFVSQDTRENKGESSGQNIEACLRECNRYVFNSGSIADFHQELREILLSL